MFKEFSDAELVVMWHRLNQHSNKFFEFYNLRQKYNGAIINLDKEHQSSLWSKVQRECDLRKLNPINLTKIVPVEVITYENKEVPIE